MAISPSEKQTSAIKSQHRENAIDKNEAIIEVSSLSFDIKNNAILKNLNFSVGTGEIYALLGGNGAGKSTTLKTLLGFNKPAQVLVAFVALHIY